MDKSFPIPVSTVATTNMETTTPGASSEPPSPESRALSETVGPLVRHDEAKQLALNVQLYNACEDHDFELIKEAVENGADPNFFVTHPDGIEKGRIPVLAYATLLGREDLVECLLEHEATARFWMLMDALVPEREAVFRTFGEYVDIDTPDLGDGSTLLHCACSTGDLWAIDLLIELGANVNAQDGIVTPLVVACARNRPDAVRLLLDHDAIIDRDAASTRMLTNILCMDTAGADLFSLVMLKRPTLWPYARDCLVKNQSNLATIKLHLIMLDPKQPQRLPRGEVNLETK